MALTYTLFVFMQFLPFGWTSCGVIFFQQLYLRKIAFDDCSTEERMRESLNEWLLLSSGNDFCTTFF
jgi:hypothetical protein